MNKFSLGLMGAASLLCGHACEAATSPASTEILPRATLARQNFGNDAPFFERNIPFFTCSDPEIQQIYYYRWKLYKSHLRDLGARGTIVTEFLDDVSWSLKPYESLNDATGFHIADGRWLRDPRPVDDYINFMFEGGNDRHFSEAITAATYDRFLVNADRALLLKNLAAMKRIYAQWDDHFDAKRGLYFIEPLLDATEYTISSIDASGGKDGFGGGDAFRPSINSFMFANARAISQIAASQGDSATATEFAAKAQNLRVAVQKNLWNEEMQHFIDRYKVDNQYVKNWDFIRGRELAGYTPWYFGLPDKTPKYNTAWAHLLDPNQLGGAYGLRTVEPSYEHYMQQYRYEEVNGVKQPECQWNGPSWPFQTTLAMGGIANLFNNYSQNAIKPNDYLRLLKQYTHQHYLNGKPNLQEDYNPDTGKVIVGLPRSNHYSHSGYVDLIINGLVGLRPRADNTLEVNPLLSALPSDSTSLSYFCLENVVYHGQNLTILFDRDGKHFNRGAGLSIYINGRRALAPSKLDRKLVALPQTKAVEISNSSAQNQSSTREINLAVNLSRRGFPVPSASRTDASNGVYQAVDGRVWFYPEVRNYWSNQAKSPEIASPADSDWFALDFGTPRAIRGASLAFYADGAQFLAPSNYTLQSWQNEAWIDVPGARKSPALPLGNGENSVSFPELKTSRLRVVFSNTKAALALVELKIFGAASAPENAPIVPLTLALVELKIFGAASAPENAPIVPLTLAQALASSGQKVVDSWVPNEDAAQTRRIVESENSRTGSFNGNSWRDAQKGGFFAFSLQIAPDADNSLVVTYWGSDVAGADGRRDFEVLVDGQKVGAQTLQDEQPGAFFNVSYPLSRALTAGKTRVTVRFQARPGALAGGVFGARIVRR